MKRIMYLIMVLMTITFSGCSDDDDDYSIVGTWQTPESEEQMILTFNSNNTGVFITLYYGEVESEELFTYVFKDNILFLTDFEGTEILAVSLSANKLVLGELIYDRVK